MGLQDVHWVDWAIVGILGLSTLLSLWRGFFKEALSLIGWVLALVLATAFANSVSHKLLLSLISNDTARYVAAYILIFISVLILAGLAGGAFSHLMKAGGLGYLDRALGTIFGFVRGLVVVLVIAFFVRQLAPPNAELPLQHSALLPHIDVLGDWISSTFDEMSDGKTS